jgi:hypothetical protein
MPSPVEVLWHKMNDNAANRIVVDSGSAANNGELPAGIETGDIDVVGKINGALTFDGLNVYINDGNPAALQLTSAMSLCAWFKSSAVPDSTAALILSKDNATDRSYNMGLEQAGTCVFNAFVAGIAITARTSTDTFKDGAWHHLVSTFDGANLKIYVDGTLLGTTINLVAIDNDAANFNIGRRSDAARWFSGPIDDVRVFSEALTLTQVGLLYNSGNGTESSLEDLIGTTNTNTGNIDTDTTTIIGHVDGIEGLIDGIEGFIDGIEGFIDGIETLLTTINTSIASLLYPSTSWSVTEAETAAVTNDAAKSAPGSSLSLYVCGLTISNGATAGDYKLVEDTAGTPVTKVEKIYTGITGGAVMHFFPCIKITENKDIGITSTTVTTGSYTITGFTAP